MLARIAVDKSPLSSTTMSPDNEIGRNRTKRNRQVIEILGEAGVCDKGSDRVFDVLRGNDAGGRRQPFSLKCRYSKAARLGTTRELVLNRRQVPPTLAADGFCPVDIENRVLNVRGAGASRIDCANQSAHARAGDTVDGNAEILEHTEHADMRRAFGAATPKYESDTRPV